VDHTIPSSDLAVGDVVRLNIGCGDRYASDWHNVDHAGSPHRKDAEVDLRLDLPSEYESLTHVYAGHVLEHLTIEECRILLFQLHCRMTPSGQIMIVGPDLIKAEAMVRAGTFDFQWGHTLDSLRYGGNRWPGDTHHWECDAEQVASMLERAGWKNVTDVGIEHIPEFWPVADRAPLWQCAVSAESAVAS
jgi:predicted SAM-dependent methyltransferase